MTGTWRRRVLSGPESNKWCKRNGLTRAQGRDDTGPRVNRSLLAERTADWRDRIWWPAGGARGEPTQLVQRRARRPKAGREGERGRRGGWGRRGGAAVAGSKPTKRAQGSAAREPAAAVERRAWGVTVQAWLAQARYWLKLGARPPTYTQPTVPNSTKLSARAGGRPRIGLPSPPAHSPLASRHRSPPTRMASSLVSRPHLTQRPVRAATLASATRPRLVAGALGGRCQAQAAGDLDDAHYMRRCVELARKAAGHTSPNPMVGCVIVRDGRVVGEGFHPKAGQPHAEVACLPLSLFNIFFGCLFSSQRGKMLLGDDRHKAQRDLAVLLGIIILQLWKAANAIFGLHRII